MTKGLPRFLIFFYLLFCFCISLAIYFAEPPKKELITASFWFCLTYIFLGFLSLPFIVEVLNRFIHQEIVKELLVFLLLIIYINIIVHYSQSRVWLSFELLKNLKKPEPSVDLRANLIIHLAFVIGFSVSYLVIKIQSMFPGEEIEDDN